jgi:transcriptional regulator with XRE-family HTH domain
MERNELSDWLIVQCRERHLSQSEASRRAGLGINAISEIKHGRTPGLKVCKALADFFGVSPLYVLRLAGLLPPVPERERFYEEICWVTEKLSAGERQLVLDFARWRLQQSSTSDSDASATSNGKTGSIHQDDQK